MPARISRMLDRASGSGAAGPEACETEADVQIPDQCSQEQRKTLRHRPAEKLFCYSNHTGRTTAATSIPEWRNCIASTRTGQRLAGASGHQFDHRPWQPACGGWWDPPETQACSFNTAGIPGRKTYRFTCNHPAGSTGIRRADRHARAADKAIPNGPAVSLSFRGQPAFESVGCQANISGWEGHSDARQGQPADGLSILSGP